MTKKPRIFRREDCWEFLEDAMSDVLSDRDERALFNLRKAARIWHAGLYNEAGGWSDDRRGGKSGKREPKPQERVMLEYALKIPARGGGGRGRKNRWRLTAEHFYPEAFDDELERIADRLRKINPEK